MRSRSWICALLAVAASAVLAPPAAAHTEVTSRTPKPGAYADRSLSVVRVRFNQPIRSGRLEVLRAGKKISVGSGRRSPGNVRAIEGRIERELDGGRYTVRWTMTAADGHTQRGSWRFRVRAAPEATPAEEAETATPTATATATASPEPTATAAPASAADDDGGGAWVAAAALLAGLAAVGGIVTLRRRSR